MVWLFQSQKAIATNAFNAKEISGQIHRNYSVLFFCTPQKDTVFFNTADNDLYPAGEKLPVFFSPETLTDAHIANFTGLWMGPLLYAALLLLLLLIIFLHPEIIPRGSNVLLLRRPPFVSILPPPTASESPIAVA